MLSRRRSCIQAQWGTCRNAPPSTDRAEISSLDWVHQLALTASYQMLEGNAQIEETEQIVTIFPCR